MRAVGRTWRGRWAQASATSVLVAAALGGLSGCSSGSGDAHAGHGPQAAQAEHEGNAEHQGQAEDADGSAPGGVPGVVSPRPADGTVLQPGRPGEPVETLPPDTTLPASRFNQVDVRFVQMMIPHHAQALEMGKLARSRAADPDVRAIAQRIEDAQAPEILGMSAWLQQRDLDAPTRADLEQHAHADHTMPGMLTRTEMRQLAAADGRRFDRMYLRSMIAHHRGAVVMARQVAMRGTDIVVGELAADISVGQTAEIDRMRAMLRRL